MKRTVAWMSWCCMIVGAASLATSAGAQESAMIEEVVVVAQKREESAEDIPMSITAFTGDQLEIAGHTDITELSYFVPSFSMATSNTSRNTNVAMRGISSSGANPGIEASIGVFVDGVYLPSAGQALGNIVDIQSFEFLRGPQGTLYGRNTPAGAINVTTRRPTQEYRASVEVSAGEHAYRAVKGFVSGGLTDALAARLTFWADDRDGWVKNLTTGDDTNDETERGVRLRIAFAPSDAVDINVIAHATKLEMECCLGEHMDPLGPAGIATPGFLAAQEALGFPFRNFDDDDRVVDGFDEGDDESTTWGTSVRVDWSLPADHVLTSITAYEEWDNTPRIAHTSLPQDAFVSYQQQLNETLSQEVRIASPVGDRRFSYLVGIFAYRQDTLFDQFNEIHAGANRNFPPPLCGGVVPCRLMPGDSGGTYFDQETQSLAAFGQGTWTLTQAWDVTAGLRFGRDEKEVFIDHWNAPDAGPAFNRIQRATRPGDRDRSDSTLTWSLDTRFHLVDNVMLFAHLATGFKSGGFNSRRLPAGAIVEFEEEDSTTVDVGFKASWFDRRLLTTLAVFRTEIENFQATVQNPDPNIPGFIVGNAGDHIVRGFEFEIQARPIAPLTLRATGAYLDGKYDNLVGFPATTPNRTPEAKWSASADWAQPAAADLEWFFRVEYGYTGEQRYGAGPHDSYAITNVRGGMRSEDGRWAVTAWAKNITDETYYVNFATQPVAGFVSGGGFAGMRPAPFGWYGMPRVYGVSLTYTVE